MAHTAADAAAGFAGSLGRNDADRISAAEIAALYDNVVIGVIGATGGAAGLAIGLVRLQGTTPAMGAWWAGSVAFCALLHILLRIGYGRSPSRHAQWRWWGYSFTAVSLAEGIAWGWGSVWLPTENRFDLQLLTFVVCYGIGAGSVTAFGSYRPAFLCIFFGATMPKFVWAVRESGTSVEAFILLMISVVFIVSMVGLGLRANSNFRALLRLQIRTDALADDLRRQKELAEQANRAKSTFLAAASHDLRQPVHALGLFVGALRGFALPQEAARLVEQIEGSTVALDGLFSAILDLSRLDAGVVDVRLRPFAIQPLLERVCRDYAEEARAKGIGFTMVPTTARVLTDPTLMERILRNFIGNAVRYTANGRVLVGCRRRGPSVRVEVRDTGRGIPADRTEWIFQEYSQLDNPERDRGKGLGLGLAIVRRLAVLLDCPIGVQSHQGRGSCFTVTIPMTHANAEALEPAGSEDRGVARDWVVLVIDDEKAIQDAMATLLSGWGHTVIAAGSADAMLERLATYPVKPDLIICDYRLRGEENGIDVVERLRSEYNDAIPAMLITGDTAPERLAEARESGLLLLHKPVPNAKLRAAMTHLVAAAEAAADLSDADQAAPQTTSDPVGS